MRILLYYQLITKTMSTMSESSKHIIKIVLNVFYEQYLSNVLFMDIRKYTIWLLEHLTFVEYY